MIRHYVNPKGGVLADLVASGDIDIPIAGTYPLEKVQDAYRELARRHARQDRHAHLILHRLSKLLSSHPLIRANLRDSTRVPHAATQRR